MRILAVSNWKGGVGKTTSALALAGSLTRLAPHLPIVVADFDVQGNASAGLGCRPPADGGAGTWLRGGAALDTCLVETRVPGLSVLPADTHLQDLRLTPEQVAYRLRLGLRDTDGILVADTPPGARAITRGVLLAAEAVVIPVQPDPYSAQGLFGLLRDVALLRPDDPPLVRVLPVMWRARGVEERNFGDLLQHRLPDQLLAAIPQNAAVRRSAHRGLPVTIAERYSPAGIAYGHAAEEVLRAWRPAGKSA